MSINVVKQFVDDKYIYNYSQSQHLYVGKRGKFRVCNQVFSGIKQAINIDRIHYVLDLNNVTHLFNLDLKKKLTNSVFDGVKQMEKLGNQIILLNISGVVYVYEPKVDETKRYKMDKVDRIKVYNGKILCQTANSTIQLNLQMYKIEQHLAFEYFDQAINKSNQQNYMYVVDNILKCICTTKQIRDNILNQISSQVILENLSPFSTVNSTPSSKADNLSDSSNNLSPFSTVHSTPSSKADNLIQPSLKPHVLPTIIDKINYQLIELPNGTLYMLDDNGFCKVTIEISTIDFKNILILERNKINNLCRIDIADNQSIALQLATNISSRYAEQKTTLLSFRLNNERGTTMSSGQGVSRQVIYRFYRELEEIIKKNFENVDEDKCWELGQAYQYCSIRYDEKIKTLPMYFFYKLLILCKRPLEEHLD
ncbi:MAG: hypothetical protein O7C56_04105, partial [Rickettsia endosymbiont of Ixodes persulcatus]|nr:hypothetical protein [Rickettsia endosymbiont of Ixodes persulcatus]